MRPAAPQAREPFAGAPAATSSRPASGSDAPGRTEPTLALPSSAFDLPLEPGSGRPRPEAAAAAGQDAQSVRQSLIAAARRSARAASEAATAPAPATEPSAKGPSRLREIMEKRKRPLLLGLAALILALGTAQVVTSTLRKDTKTVSNESRSLIAPLADAPAAQPQSAPAENAPAKDQSSALPAPAEPSATASAAASNGAADKPAAPAIAPTAPTSAPAPDAAPEAAAASPSSEPVQTVTGLGDLPAGLGSAGLRKAALDGLTRDSWAEWCICEDSELGLRLFRAGWKAVYSSESFGRGVMPDDFAAYRKQRHRWAFGAMQILRRHAGALFSPFNRELSLGQRWHFVTGWLPWIGDALGLVFTLLALAWSAGLILAPNRFEFPIALFMLRPASRYSLRSLCPRVNQTPIATVPSR